MPLYDVICPKCDREEEVVNYGDPITCPDCGAKMVKKVSRNIRVKMKGEGGYPSRRKQIFNTTYRNHPKLEHEPNRSSYF